MPRLVDLSHELVPGDATYPWLPAPRLTEFLSRESSRGRYAPGTTFVIHQVEFIGNSGTYLDAPSHRHESGFDLAELPLDRVANLPGRIIDVVAFSDRAIGASVLDSLESRPVGHAVLFRTGWASKWGSREYPEDAPFISESLARKLVESGVALVGVDALNVDDTDDPARPAHTILLGAGIPVVENLCRLGELPLTGFRFSAVPARMRGCSAFPVRAFAIAD